LNQLNIDKMSKLIAKLDLKENNCNLTTLKIYLIEGGELEYRMSSTRNNVCHSMSNITVGYKDKNKSLPDHIQDIKNKDLPGGNMGKLAYNLKQHILECIEDSNKIYIPESYVTYHILHKYSDKELEQEKSKTGVPKQLIADSDSVRSTILRSKFRNALIRMGARRQVEEIESRVENSYKESTK
tara:strand:+ start:584 stop:1135 length:552 start_codon:yes stop_codon:yes gene_type:complete